MTNWGTLVSTTSAASSACQGYGHVCRSAFGCLLQLNLWNLFFFFKSEMLYLQLKKLMLQLIFCASNFFCLSLIKHFLL